MTITKIFALTLAAVTLFAGGDARAEGKQWTTIRIATEGAFRPWNFTEPDGRLNGFEIDLYKDLCARMKVTCEMSAQSFDGIIPALNAGKFDAIMAGMSATAKREEVIAFIDAVRLDRTDFCRAEVEPSQGAARTGAGLLPG